MLLRPLADAGYRVLAIDGRGQHESVGPDEESAYAQAELAADVAAQNRALGGDTHLLGHSLGGLICRAAVLEDSTSFRSLTLMSSGPAAVCPRQQERLKLLLGALPTMDMAAIWQIMRDLDPPEAPDQATPQEVREFLERRWMNTRSAQLTAAAQQLLVEPDRVEALASTPLPKHVLSGVVDDVWPVEEMDKMATALDARRTVIEHAEHSPAVDNPSASADALIGFWNRHSG